MTSLAYRDHWGLLAWRNKEGLPMKSWALGVRGDSRPGCLAWLAALAGSLACLAVLADSAGWPAGLAGRQAGLRRQAGKLGWAVRLAHRHAARRSWQAGRLAGWQARTIAG